MCRGQPRYTRRRNANFGPSRSLLPRHGRSSKSGSNSPNCALCGTSHSQPTTRAPSRSLHLGVVREPPPAPAPKYKYFIALETSSSVVGPRCVALIVGGREIQSRSRYMNSTTRTGGRGLERRGPCTSHTGECSIYFATPGPLRIIQGTSMLPGEQWNIAVCYNMTRS